MRKYILIGLCTLCMGLIAGEGFARGLNARTEALAGAGIGLIGSGQAIQYNPAGLAFMDGWEAHFTFVDREYNQYIAGVARNTGIGTFGLSAINYGYYSSDYTIFSGYGVMITDRLAVGAILRLFHSGDFKTDDLDFDLGTYFLTGLRNTVVAAGVENVSTGIGNLGRVRLRAGLFFDLMSLLDPESLSHYLDLALEVNDYINDDRGSWANLGIEYQYRYLLSSYALEIALRGGVQSIYGIGSPDTTWGVGLKFETEGGRGIRVDYAPLTTMAYPDQHIVSMAFIF